MSGLYGTGMCIRSQSKVDRSPSRSLNKAHSTIATCESDRRARSHCLVHSVFVT